MRTVDGLKIGFVTHEVYFESMMSPSMFSTSKTTGADVVFLLAEGKTEDDITDDEIREILKAAMEPNEGDEVDED